MTYIFLAILFFIPSLLHRKNDLEKKVQVQGENMWKTIQTLDPEALKKMLDKAKKEGPSLDLNREVTSTCYGTNYLCEVIRNSCYRIEPYKFESKRCKDVFSMVKLLVDNGADPMVTPSGNFSPLELAIQASNFEVVQYLLNKFTHNIFKVTRIRTPPLYYALIENPFFPYNSKEYKEWRCYQDSKKIIHLLLEKGAKESLKLFLNDLDNRSYFGPYHARLNGIIRALLVDGDNKLLNTILEYIEKPNQELDQYIEQGHIIKYGNGKISLNPLNKTPWPKYMLTKKPLFNLKLELK
jgi:ankyrin repeat protein